MHIPSRHALPILALLLLTSCTGVSPTRIIGDTVGAASGALLGHAFGKRNPAITAAGAGAGVLLGETLQAGSSAAQQKSYASGYEKGRSDAAKHEFRTLNERQRFAPTIDDNANVRLIEIPLPERQVNGAILAPSTATLRIQE